MTADMIFLMAGVLGVAAAMAKSGQPVNSSATPS